MIIFGFHRTYRVGNEISNEKNSPLPPGEREPYAIRSMRQETRGYRRQNAGVNRMNAVKSSRRPASMVKVHTQV